MPPPPPPSASYNLNLDDFSDSSEEENDYYSSHRQNTAMPSFSSTAAVHKTDGYVVNEQANATVVSLTELRQRYADGKVSKEEFAAALRAHQVNTADNGSERMMVNDESEPEVVEAFNVTALSDNDSDHDDDNDDPNSRMDIDGPSTIDGEISSPVRKKKKKKKKVSASCCFAC